jgi:hypothetical protein
MRDAQSRGTLAPAEFTEFNQVGGEVPLPNMRVQRTRSSASPPRSPLMRRPLGGTTPCLCFLAVTLLVTHTSCVSTAFFPSSDVSINCRVKEDLDGRTRLSVEVVDVFVGEPPSMLIKMRCSDDPDSPLFEQHVDKNPAEFDALPAGRWDLEISIPTSPHSAHCTVNLKENWSCRVRVAFLESRT